MTTVLVTEINNSVAISQRLNNLVIESLYNSVNISEQKNTVNLTNLINTVEVSKSIISAQVLIGGPRGNPGAGVAISASNSSMLGGTVSFKNENNVSFGLSEGIMTASINAQQSVLGNSNNVSFTSIGNVVVASASYSQSTHPHTSVSFNNANGVSFGLLGSTITASVKTDFLTTAALSNHSHSENLTTAALSNHSHTFTYSQYLTTAANSSHTHGGPTLALTNLNGTIASASSGLSISLSQGANSAFQLGNANGVSFGTTGSTVTASVKTDYLTTAALSNHGHSQYITTAALSNHSHSENLTTAALSNHSHSENLTTAALSNHSHSEYLTTAALSNHVHSQYLTTAAATNHTHSQYLSTAAATNHSHGNPTLALTYLSGSTASASNGLTLSLSAYPAPIIWAGTQLASTGTVMFSNANGISFAMVSNSRITASHNGLTTAAATDHSHGNPTLALTNISGTTNSASNGFTLSLSAVSQPVAASASNGSFNFSTLQFGNLNGFSFKRESV